MMETKQKKAQEIHTLVAELNKQITEAAEMGLTVEVRPDYTHYRRNAKEYRCYVGEYISYP